jgi:antirestriction protein
VASLSDYNAGNLHGEWIDADQELEQVHSKIRAMLAKSDEPWAEEYAVHDHEGFEGFSVHEYEQIDTLVQVARGIATHGQAFAYWAEHCRTEFGHAEFGAQLERFEETFIGHFDSLLAYAEASADDLGIEEAIEKALPGSLQSYVKIDYEALAQDLAADLVVTQAPSGIFIFYT